MIAAASRRASWIQSMIWPSCVDLPEPGLEAAAGGKAPAELLDVGQRLVTIDLGLTHAEQVQVRPVQNVDPLAHGCTSVVLDDVFGTIPGHTQSRSMTALATSVVVWLPPCSIGRIAPLR